MSNGSNILRPQPRWTQKFPRHVTGAALTDEIRNIYRILNLLGKRVPMTPPSVEEPPGAPPEPWEPPTDHQQRYFFVVPIEWHSHVMDFAWAVTPDIPGGTAWRMSQLDLWLIASDHTGAGCPQVYEPGGYSEWWFELRARGVQALWFEGLSDPPLYPLGYGTPETPYLGWWEHCHTSVQQGPNPNDPGRTYWLNQWFQTAGSGNHYIQLRGHGWAGDPDPPDPPGAPPCSVGDPDCCYLAVLTGCYELAPAFFPFGDICPFDPYL